MFRPTLIVTVENTPGIRQSTGTHRPQSSASFGVSLTGDDMPLNATRLAVSVPCDHGEPCRESPYFHHAMAPTLSPRRDSTSRDLHL
ncbi:hypothetical protein BV20DRAFT_235321 [Pilatotrama ljubarskyi]|nr:hypothetical protein BV20DRAFT_235321 [Pilatotrama ljubarskyi]